MAYSSDHHFIKIDVRDLTGFGATPFVVQALHGVEGISQLFRLRVDLLSNHVIPFDKVVGHRVALEMKLQTVGERRFHGIVSEFAQGGTYRASGGGSEMVRYEAVVVPRLWTLTRSVNSRVWEDRTVQQIVEDVLEKTKSAGERVHDVDFEFKTLNETHPTLTYTVQYYETDFDFFSRLLEEQGLAYHFFHDRDHEQLVIFDTSAELGALKDQYAGTNWEEKDPTALPSIRGPVYGAFAFDGASQSQREWQIDTWTVRQGISPGVTSTRGYDFTQPANYPESFSFRTLDVNADTSKGVAGKPFEVWEFQPDYTDEAGARFGQYQQQAEEAAAHVIEARGACAAFEPGSFIQLKGSYPKVFDTEKYLITRVHHMLTQSVGASSGVGESSYENAFSCLPDVISYRSRQTTPKPSVHGTETAVVVGPDGEEIETDKWGRIRIQFHWDHQKRKNKGEQVCWARVAQSLAGTGWGSIYTPRIGQEVVVTFIQGNPDRPLVTGVVYNGTHKVPWELDAKKTRSGIKTRSSKEGSKTNYNELRFEDKKGSELILIHAERNMSTTVEANYSLTVGNKRTETIHKGQSTTVKDGGSEFTAKGLTSFSIDGSMEAIAGDGIILDGTTHDACPATPQLQLNSEHIKLEMGSSKFEATSSQIELTVGGSKVTIVDGKITLDSADVTVKGGTVTVTGTPIKLN